MTDPEYAAASADLYGTVDERTGQVLPVREMVRTLGRERFVAYMVTRGLRDLYFFDRAILGYAQMVPHLHGDLCDFGADPTHLRKLYLIPRGHYKSSCITIGKTLQKILRDPTRRIGIFHETAVMAWSFVGVMEAHLTRNELLRQLYADRMPPVPIPRTWPWRKDGFSLPRPQEFPEPTVLGLGVGGASQGKHFTDMVWDDLIGEEAAANEEVMEKVIDWMKKGESLSVTPHELVLDIIGTRWGYFDIYSWAMDEGYPSLPVFHRSAVVQEGDQKRPLFPEQFTMEVLDELARKDFYIFSCQYLNDPISSELNDFHPEWLRYYSKEDRAIGPSHVPYVVQEDTREIDEGQSEERLSRMTVLIHVDPSPGLVEGLKKKSARHSRPSIQVVGLAYPRRVFLLHCFLERCSVDALTDKILDYVEAYDEYLRCVTMEAHGWTRMLRAPLLKRASERKIALHEGRVKEYTKSAATAKEARIRKLVPYFADGQIFIEHGNYELEKEYRAFPRGRSWDGLDALAQGPDYWEPWPEAPTLYRHPTIHDTVTEDQGRSEVTGY